MSQYYLYLQDPLPSNRRHYFRKEEFIEHGGCGSGWLIEDRYLNIEYTLEILEIPYDVDMKIISLIESPNTKLISPPPLVSGATTELKLGEAVDSLMPKGTWISGTITASTSPQPYYSTYSLPLSFENLRFKK